MPIINRIAEFHEDMKEWRQHLHSIPELTFDCHKTSAFVIERLREHGLLASADREIASAPRSATGGA